MFGEHHQIAKADAFAPRTSLHGHIYRPRPNGLETLKDNPPLAKRTDGSFCPAMSRWTYLRERRNDAYGEGELRTARRCADGASRKRGRAPPPHRLSFAKSRRTLASELGAEEDVVGNQQHLGGDYFLYTVGCGPFSSVLRSQIMPSRV